MKNKEPETETETEIEPVKAESACDGVQKLLQENLEISKEIQKNTKYIKHHVIWQQVFGVIKLLIIAIPIVLGILYLPPILKDLFSQYQSILGLGGLNPLNSVTPDLKLDSLSPELLNMLKK